MKILSLIIIIITNIFGLNIQVDKYTNKLPTNHSIMNVNPNSKINFDKWNESIQKSSRNDNVKLFVSWTTSFANIQLAEIINYMLLDKPNRVGTDDILWFYDFRTLDKWNVKYLIDKYDPNYPYDKTDNRNENSKKNASEFYFRVIDNIARLTLNDKDDAWYARNLEEALITPLLDYYINKNPNVKFDLWILEGSLEGSWNNYYEATGFSPFYRLLKRTQHIYVISDGNYQTYYFIKNVLDYFSIKGSWQNSESEIDDLIDRIWNDPLDSSEEGKRAVYKEFSRLKLYDFIHSSKLFTFFHLNSYTESPYYLNKLPIKMQLYKTYSLNYNYYDFAKTFFATNQQKFNEFITNFEKYFKLESLTSIYDFLNLNKEKYNKNKKNLIWFGDSLILNKDHIYPERKLEINNVMKGLFNRYNKNEFNYFVKHHPSYNETQQQWLTKEVINNSEIENELIYMNPFPWELFLSWDYKEKSTNSEYKSFFDHNNTIFIGFQFTTTTIQTSSFFFEKFYNYTLDDINKVFGNNNFPIPQTFDIISRQKKVLLPYRQQEEINRNKINDIYNPFIDLNVFPKIDKTLSAEKFIREFVDKNYYLADQNPIDTINLILKIFSFPLVLIVSNIVVLLIIYLGVKKRKVK